MRFMYGADFHWSEQTPVHRKDNFLAAQEKKIRKMFEIASDYKVSKILQGGDLFHHHQANYWFAHWMIVLLRELMAKHKMGPIVVNQGNHDVLGGRLPTTYEGALGMMADAGVVQLLTTEGPYEDRTFDEVDFRFIPYRLQPNLEAYSTNRIIINHDMVTTYDTPFDHFLYTDVAEKTRSPLVLCSHWHYQFQERAKDTLFVNPGPMMRRSWSERKGDPSVAIVDVHEPPQCVDAIRVEFVSLQGDKDVFKEPDQKNEDALHQVEQAYEVAEEFVRALKSSVETMSVDEVIRKISKELKLSSETLSYALDKLQQARAVEVKSGN